MALARSTVRNERSRVSLVASIGGYLAILVVTFGATLMAAATALGENRPPEDKADSTIAISVVASVVVAAVAAVSLRHTRRPSNYWLFLPALLACLGLTLAVVLLAYRGTSQALDYWDHPTPTGDAGNGRWKLAALIAFACPFVVAALGAFRAGAGRLFLLAAALTSFAWLAMVAFDQVARASL